MNIFLYDFMFLDLMRELSLQKTLENRNWVEHFEKKYSFEFFQPTFDKVPYVSKLFADNRVRRVLDCIEYSLLASYPIYVGTNSHEKMIKLRDGFSKEEYVWYRTHNKLSINNIDKIAGAGMILLKLLLRKDYLRIKLINNKEYNNLDFETKFIYYRSVDNEVHTILERLHDDYAKNI